MEYQNDLPVANGADIQRWFAAGAGEVAANRKYLNLINVFPVADGDTGTNLAATLSEMVRLPMRSTSFSQTLTQLSQSAMQGAHGNSGIIFASYINGLAMEGKPYERVTVAQFAGVAFNAVKYLYQSVDHPEEGTMMSLIRDWAAFLHHNHPNYLGFQALFTAAYREAAAALEKTKTQLEVLRRHNVVDSGAAGFVRFLAGINHVLSDHDIPPVAEKEPKSPLLFTENETLTKRYCTEAIVALSPGFAEPGKAIRNALAPLGDSLIVSPWEGHVKVHIHTDTPELVMERLATFGVPGGQKADDMVLQNRLRARPVGGIGIVTDSIADLPEAFIDQHAISVLPMGLFLHGAACLDKVTVRLPRLFAAMESAEDYPTSSQPEPERIRSLLADRLERFDSLIVLSVSSKLSNTCQALTQVAEKLSTPKKPVTVVDTKLNSGAQGLMVKLAAELAESGASHQEIVRQIKERIPRTKIYVCLNTLAYAVRGGRVPDTIGRLGMKLGLRPIMTLDARGRGAAFGVAFSQAGLTRKILRLVRRAVKRGGVEAYAIVHGDNLPLAMAYRDQLTKITGLAPSFITEISSVVALHAGPGTVAVCLTEGGKS